MLYCTYYNPSMMNTATYIYYFATRTLGGPRPYFYYLLITLSIWMEFQFKDFSHRGSQAIKIVSVTKASYECNFWALKCIKTYLRNSVTQQHLNHSLVLHIHRERTNALNLISIAKEANERRTAFFGQF